MDDSSALNIVARGLTLLKHHDHQLVADVPEASRLERHINEPEPLEVIGNAAAIGQLSHNTRDRPLFTTDGRHSPTTASQLAQSPNHINPLARLRYLALSQAQISSCAIDFMSAPILRICNLATFSFCKQYEFQELQYNFANQSKQTMTIQFFRLGLFVC